MAAGPSGEAPPRHVEIKMVAQDEDRALKAVLSELLDRLQVTTHFTTIPTLETEEMWNHAGAAPAVARAWIDLREPGQVTLYLTGDQQDRVLIRQVPLVRNLDEVAREEIAHIVEAAVDELLLGGQIGVEKKHDADLPPRAVLPPPLPEPPLRLDIGFGYAAQGWDEKRAPLHGPAAFVSLAKKTGPWRPGAWVSAELRFPEVVRKDNEPVQMTLDQGALRLLFVVDHSLTSRWIVRGGVGGGLDWIHVVPSESGTSNDAQPAFNRGTRAVAMLRALAIARYALAVKSELFFGLAADVDPSNARYVVDTVNGEQTRTTPFFHPWPIRPMAMIGITADVLAY